MYEQFTDLDGHDFDIVKPCLHKAFEFTLGNVPGTHFQASLKASVCLNNLSVNLWHPF